MAVHDNNEEWRPAALERRAQASARARAKRQLSRVSSPRFENAQREYIKWEAFSLWVRAIADAEKGLPAGVVRALRQRCPSLLLQGRTRPKILPKILPLHVLEWIHNHVFSVAKRQGWLDALVFYAVRDPRSQRTWAYWGHCEHDWKRKRPCSYPTFKQWVRAIEKWK